MIVEDFCHIALKILHDHETATRAGAARSADPGGLTGPAQDAGQGKLDLFGQARGLAEARVRGQHRAGLHTRGGRTRGRASLHTRGRSRLHTRGRTSLHTRGRTSLHTRGGRTRLHTRGCRAGSRARCGSGRHAGHRADARGSRAAGLPNVTAVAALDLAEPAHQVRAGAHRAPVELSGPVHGRLAGWADQHLAVGPNPSFPGSLSPVRVDLPCATPIAGHEVCSDSAVPRERADR
jgi:hypothetical protein